MTRTREAQPTQLPPPPNGRSPENPSPDSPVELSDLFTQHGFTASGQTIATQVGSGLEVVFIRLNTPPAIQTKKEYFSLVLTIRGLNLAINALRDLEGDIEEIRGPQHAQLIDLKDTLIAHFHQLADNYETCHNNGNSEPLDLETIAAIRDTFEQTNGPDWLWNIIRSSLT